MAGHLDALGVLGELVDGARRNILEGQQGHGFLDLGDEGGLYISQPTPYILLHERHQFGLGERDGRVHVAALDELDQLLQFEREGGLVVVE